MPFPIMAALGLGGTLASLIGGNKNKPGGTVNVPEYNPQTQFQNFGPAPEMDLSQIQGILSGDYQVDPELRQQMMQIASEMSQRGETDYAIQQALHNFWKQRQQQAAGYEKTIGGYIGDVMGVDPNTGKALGNRFDPRDQASIAGFKYLAPELAGAASDAEARRQQIQRADVDDITKARLSDQVGSDYYKAATAARENQRGQALQMLSGLHQTARNTQAAPIVGWNQQAGSLLQGIGGLDQGAAGLGLQQNLGLAGYMGQQQGQANQNYWNTVGRSDANAQYGMNRQDQNFWNRQNLLTQGQMQQAGRPSPWTALGGALTTFGPQIYNSFRGKPKTTLSSFTID